MDQRGRRPFYWKMRLVGRHAVPRGLGLQRTVSGPDGGRDEGGAGGGRGWVGTVLQRSRPTSSRLMARVMVATRGISGLWSCPGGCLAGERVGKNLSGGRCGGKRCFPLGPVSSTLRKRSSHAACRRFPLSVVSFFAFFLDCTVVSVCDFAKPPHPKLLHASSIPHKSTVARGASENATLYPVKEKNGGRQAVTSSAD